MRKIKNLFLQTLITGLLLCLPVQASVLAAPAAQGASGGGSSTADQTAAKPSECISGKVLDNGDCAPALGNGCSNDPQNTDGQQSCLARNPIIKYLKIIINSLAAGVAVVVTAMIIYGGIQYMSGGDNSNAISEAKKRITNAIVALVTFTLIYALLQWLIPGGVF